jgi:hypothetical protein
VQHVDEGAVEEASVEWIMVRMGLLAYYKYLFLSFYDAMSYLLLLCGVRAG